MFGYKPNSVYELKPSEISGLPVERTKSRAYKMAVCMGPCGIQWAFLGKPVWWIGWSLLRLVSLVPMLVMVYTYQPLEKMAPAFAFWLVFLVAHWLAAIWLIARRDDNDPLFQGFTPPDFFPLTFTRTGMWGLRLDERWWVKDNHTS